MTFKQCVENFPLINTLVGTYSTDQSFSVPRGSDVDDIEKWDNNPFWEDDSCYSFVVFIPTTKKFECWSFVFSRVRGYINETSEDDEFYPATYTEGFGWEKIDPFDPRLEDQITLPDLELAEQLEWPSGNYAQDKWRRKQVAYLFDAESYLNGFTFTSAAALKNFVKNRQDLL